jgi:hypothetical protein
MTLREQISEQIRQNRRPLRICGAIAGGLMLCPLVFIGKMRGLINPGESGPLFVILALAGGVLLIVLAMTKGRIRCPKCLGLLGYDDARTGKYCRHCRADFDAEGPREDENRRLADDPPLPPTDGNSRLSQQPEAAPKREENVTPSLTNTVERSRCPACGALITANDESCPSCEIAFVADGSPIWTLGTVGPADGIYRPPTEVSE